MSNSHKHIPFMRTCLICRTVKNKFEFIRFDKQCFYFPEDKSQCNGRAAYICNSPDCIKKTIKQRAYNRYFKCNIEESVYQILEEMNEKNSHA